MAGFNDPLSPAQQAATGQKTVADLFNAQAASNGGGQTGLQLWTAQNQGTGGSTTTTTDVNAQLKQGFADLQAAAAAGDQQKYDLALGTLMGIMNGQPTLAAQQAVGTVNGQPTLDAQKQAEVAREYNLSQGQSLLDTASKLNGPADWGKYLQYTSGGKNLYDQAMTGRAASGAPVGASQPQTLQSLMSAFGMTGAPAAGPAGAAAANPASQQALYRQLMGDSVDYMPGHIFTPADVQASGGYANAKASNFATFGGTDPTMGGGGDTPAPVDAPPYSGPQNAPYEKGGDEGLSYPFPAGATQAYKDRTLDMLLRNYDPQHPYPPEITAAIRNYIDQGSTDSQSGSSTAQLLMGGKADSGGGGTDTTGDQATYRSLMGDAPDYSPTTVFTPDQVRASGGYQNAQASNFATFGGRDPLLGPAPAAPAPAPAPAAPATPPNPAPTGINSTGEAANNTALLNSLGFGAPNLSQNDLTRLSGGNATATSNDVLASPTYRQLTGAQGTSTDTAAASMQDYEHKLQALNNPGAMDPAFWDSLGPDGQQAWLGAAQQIFGWTPEEYIRQINATRPLGSVQPPASIPVRYAPVGV